MKAEKTISGNGRKYTVKFRCSANEKKIIQNKAAYSGKNISEYCRGEALHGKIFAARKLTEKEQEYFTILKSYNRDWTLIANYIKHKNPELHRAI